jgi:lipopolysaccharide biosynthesis glycosyltransferase
LLGAALATTVVLRVLFWGDNEAQNARDTLARWDHQTAAAARKNPGIFHAPRAVAVPIRICPEAMAKSHFAIASMITVPAAEHEQLYQRSAAKLAVSIRRWSPNLVVDLILLLALEDEQEEALVDTKMLAESGWTLCRVGSIASPEKKGVKNRFLDSNMFSRLRLWELQEYMGILSLDTDMVVSKDISSIFSMYYPLVIERGQSMSAVKDALSAPCTNPDSLRTTFNAGLLLLIPGQDLYVQLTGIVADTDAYDINWAEQGLLNSVFAEGSYVELPFVYNAHMAELVCNRTRWGELQHDIAIFHYTVVKGWSLRASVGTLTWVKVLLWSAIPMCSVWEQIPVVWRGNE